MTCLIRTRWPRPRASPARAGSPKPWHSFSACSEPSPRGIRHSAPRLTSFLPDGSPQSLTRRPSPRRRLVRRLHASASKVGRLGSGLGLRGLVQPTPVSTPDIVPEGGQFIEATYSNPAGTRAYKLYIPSGYHGQALPLIVMLHGCTQSPDDFAAGTRMNLIAEEQA